MNKSSNKKNQKDKTKLLKGPTQATSSTWVDGQLSRVPVYLANFYQTNAKGSDLSGLSVEMQEIIKDAYSTFSQYAVPVCFNVCTYCCMSIEEEYALRTIPLSMLPGGLVYSYNGSAKVELVSKDEVAYLLPRTLELIALGEEIHHSTELYLDWAGQVPSEQWTQQEKELLERFALQYTKDVFQQAKQMQVQWHVEIDSILIMFCYAGIDIQPILDWLAQCPDYYVITSIAFLIGYSSDEKSYITNAFKEKVPQLDGIFNFWLEKNIEQLQENASYITSYPEKFAKMDDFYIKQGLSELMAFRYKHLM